MPDTDWLNPTNVVTVVDLTPALAAGNVDWNNPNNVFTSNDQYAQAINVGSVQASYWIVVNAFGASIPDGATIDGVEVRIEMHTSSVADGTSGIGAVTLTQSTTRFGSPKFPDQAVTTSDVYYPYGGSSDSWGGTLSESLVENANFGFALFCPNAAATSKTLSVDHMQLKIYYTGGAFPEEAQPQRRIIIC